jgi:hypothetical protein
MQLFQGVEGRRPDSRAGVKVYQLLPTIICSVDNKDSGFSSLKLLQS